MFGEHAVVGRKVREPHTEKILQEFILKEKLGNREVNRQSISKYARSLKNTACRFTKGWLDKFMKRNHELIHS